MPISLSARLSLMMFLNYVVWGAWYVTLGTYLTTTLKFSGTEAGAVFGTTALACMISPFFVGLVADRYFASERVLAVLHLLGGLFLYLAAQATTFGPVYFLLLLHCLCYFPTISLTNSLTLRQLTNAGSQFPLIRVFATLGWIAIGVLVGNLGVEATATPFLIAAGFSLLMSIYSLTLPHTPPVATRSAVTWKTVLGLDALVMLRDRSFLIFVIASVLACIPLAFYFSFTNAFLNESGVRNAAGKMTLGQVSEVGVMLLMPFIFRRFSLKVIFLVGLLAWAVRYFLLAYGDAGNGIWMFYAAILLHGICYDFFFMTGQLYTDQEAPAHLRGTAQGLLTFLTYGVGMFIGSLLSGRAVDYFTVSDGVSLVRNWNGFWVSSGMGAFAIFLLVALMFRGGQRVGSSGAETKASAPSAKLAEGL